MRLSDRGKHFYRTFRRDGMPAMRAYRMARTEDLVYDVLGPDHDGYDVDTDALARHTAGPALNVILPDGTHPERTLRFPDGVEVVVRVNYDEDAGTPWDELDEDGGCYSREDAEAWSQDEWHFVTIEVEAVLPDGDTFSEFLGGVEQGDHWPGSGEAQVWHAVEDKLGEVLGQVEARLAEVKAAEAAALADLNAELEAAARAEYRARRDAELRRRLVDDLNDLNEQIALMIPRVASGQTTQADADILATFTQDQWPAAREAVTTWSA